MKPIRIKTVFTHPSVLAGIEAGADWADPTMDPARIDWERRQREAWIWFDVIDGRPINPVEDTGIDEGRNELGHWGEGKAADALIFTYKRIWTWKGPRKVLHMVMVERGDGHGWAIPGGGLEPGESAVVAAAREALEETTMDVDRLAISRIPFPPCYVPDPRASNEAWMVTTPVIFWLRQPVPVRGGDDAVRAEWVRADGFTALDRDIKRRFGGKVFAAHVGLLKKMLARRR